MLPNMSDVLPEWEQAITLRTITTTTVDFERVDTVVDVPLRAVVQPTKAEDISVQQVDFSLRHYTIHTVEPISITSRIVYQATEYKAIQLNAWGDYGYYEAVFEEVK